MFEEWSATLMLTENSSKELFRILREQDEEFINALLDGKCGFTLTSNDGRCVELVPYKAEQTEPSIEDKAQLSYWEKRARETYLKQTEQTTEDCSDVGKE